MEMNTFIRMIGVAVLPLVFLLSCDDEPAPGPRPAHQTVDVMLQDENGRDLLDQEQPDAYNPDDIQLYFLIDNQEVLMANVPYIGDPSGITYHGPEGTYIPKICSVSLFLAYDKAVENGRTTAIVKWNKTDADTIVCEVNPDYLNEIEKIYLNGEFVWDTRTVSPIYKVAGEPEVIIVK